GLYRASDVAGKLTSEESIAFKIEQPAPELAVFEPQQQVDPQLIEVAAFDKTSGLADGGEIMLRRIAPTQGPWITLATIHQGNRYYAHVANATLVAGEYELRATIPDQAGNETLATTDREGRQEILHITPTQVGPYPTVVPARG